MSLEDSSHGSDGGALITPQTQQKRTRSSGLSSNEDDVLSYTPEDDILDAAMEEVAEEERASRETLFALCAKLDAVVASINAHLRTHGFPNLHVGKVREKSASYRCGCGKKGCFPVSFQRIASVRPAHTWMLKSMPAKPSCEPQGAVAVALCHTFIPDMVKLQLLLLFDAGVPVAQAHTTAIEKARELQLPTTWLQSDVKNLFDSLKRRKDEVLTGILHDLSVAGHHVTIDWQLNAVKEPVLNRFLVTTLAMKKAYQHWGHLCVLDATYGKNSLLMPVQCFVGITSENVIIPFSVGSTRSEVAADYIWLVETFFDHHGSLPSTWVTDGDEKIFGSISLVAAAKGVVVHLLLCIWHLFQNIKRHLASKNVAFVETDVKRLFYHCRGARSEAEFMTCWDAFMCAYGTKDAMRNYLEKELFSTRAKWCLAWVDTAFHATLMASSPSESFHALLASGHSANRTMASLIMLIDGVTVKQLAQHEQRCVIWEKAQGTMTDQDLPGLALLAAAQLLSGAGKDLFHSRVIEGLLLQVRPTTCTDMTFVNAWTAQGLLGPAELHLVQQIDPVGWTAGPAARLDQQRIHAALMISGA